MTIRYRYRGRFISQSKAASLSNLRNINKHITAELAAPSRKTEFQRRGYAVPRKVERDFTVTRVKPEPRAPEVLPVVEPLPPPEITPEEEREIRRRYPTRRELGMRIKELERREAEREEERRQLEEFYQALHESDLFGLPPMRDEAHWMDELFGLDFEYYLLDIDEEGESEYEEAS